MSIPTLNAGSTNRVDGTGGGAKKKGPLSLLLGAGRTYFLFAIIAAVIAMFAVLTLLSQVTARTTYYVLTQDVAERTEITTDMLKPVDALKGTAPANALGLGELVTDDGNPKVAQFALRAGEPVTLSNVAAPSRIYSGYPADFVVTSFKAEAFDAVAGKIRAGDSIDVIAVLESTDSTGPVGKVILHDVLVVDVNVAPDTIVDGATDGDVAPGPDSAMMRDGIPVVYSVAVSPADAAKLAVASEVRLIATLLSPDAPDTVSASASLQDLLRERVVGSSAPKQEATAEPTPQPVPTAPAGVGEPQPVTPDMTAPQP